MPWPCIETPVAEYSQSTRCGLANPGATTERPMNHASGDGQYSVTATPRSHRPRLRRLGGGGILAWRAAVGTRPPLIKGAPPVIGVGLAAAAAAKVVRASAANTVSAASRRVRGVGAKRWVGRAGIRSAARVA
jgi:hypothetical protein